jgi:hypothetical protein
MRLNDTLPYLVLAAVLLLVKFVTITAYGNDTPFWDQWDAQAEYLFRPWLEDRLSLSSLFAAHNEHRILMTRILALLIFEANGRVWSPLLEMYVNACLHIVAICILTYLCGKSLPESRRPFLLFFVGVLFSIPFGWENTLAGFQSQFYFLLLFMPVFLWSMVAHETYSPRWWLGAAAGLLSPLTVASGALTPLAGAVILAFKRLLDKPKSGVAISAIVLLLVAAGVSIMLTPTMPHHAALKAQSVTQFLGALGKVMSWPGAKLKIGPQIIHLPLVILTVFVIRNPSRRTPANYFVIALGVWVFGQFIASAYARSGSLSPRYLDLFAIGLVANFASLLGIFDSCANWRKIQRAMLAAWLAVVMCGFVTQAPRLVHKLDEKAMQGREQEKNVRAYLCTGDIAAISWKPSLHIPYPSTERLASILESPTVRSFLPGNIHEPNARHSIGSDGIPFCSPTVLLTNPFR